MKRILGLDVSLTRAGIAPPSGVPGVLVAPKSVGLGVERLNWILGQVMQHTMMNDAQLVDLVVLEGYSYASENVAHQLGEIGGLIRWALWKRRVPFVVVAPGTLKKYATGKGTAKKPEMMAAAIRRLGYAGHDDNEADAMWLRQAGLDWYRCAGAVVMPSGHREALEKINWPEVRQ